MSIFKKSNYIVTTNVKRLTLSQRQQERYTYWEKNCNILAKKLYKKMEGYFVEKFKNHADNTSSYEFSLKFNPSSKTIVTEIFKDAETRKLMGELLFYSYRYNILTKGVEEFVLVIQEQLGLNKAPTFYYYYLDYHYKLAINITFNDIIFMSDLTK